VIVVIVLRCLIFCPEGGEKEKMTPVRITVQVAKERHHTALKNVYVPDTSLPLTSYLIKTPAGQVRTRFGLGRKRSEVLFPGETNWEQVPTQQAIDEGTEFRRVRIIFARQDGLKLRTEIGATSIPLEEVPDRMRQGVKARNIVEEVIAHGSVKLRIR